VIALILLFLLLPVRGLADCVEDAALSYRISPLLLRAIESVESGGNPYALSIQTINPKFLKSLLDKLGIKYTMRPYKGRVLFSVQPSSKQEAEQVLNFLKSSPGVVTYDVGLMQVNKLWIEKYNLRPEWLLDACYNAKWGAYVLAKMIAKYGYSWDAVWHYNGKKSYAWRVFRKIKDLCRSKSSGFEYCRLITQGGKE